MAIRGLISEDDFMTVRLYAALFFISVAMHLGIATQESVPGYMDADYYYSSGLRIANDGLWSEPFIWNYLDDPKGLPHPAFTYWMPIAGIVSALGIKLSGVSSFWGARIGFVLIAGCLPPLTAFLAYTFTPQRWASLLAGAIALFSGFYFAYLPTTETFGIYMLLGSLFFILVMKLQQDTNLADSEYESIKLNKFGFNIVSIESRVWVYLAIGVIVGLMYLTRADGLIWLGMGLAAIFTQWSSRNKSHLGGENRKGVRTSLWIPLVLFLLAFLIIISPWVLRNIISFGSIFAPGSGRAFWLTSYDEIYAYPASKLTFNRWLSSGIMEILQARAWSLGLNTLTSFAVQGGIFLLPLILGGLWAHRKDWRVGVVSGGWLVSYLVMTLIFPFQGARGGFFHAGAGFQPLFWALVPAGLVVFINWGVRKKNWQTHRSIKLFSAGIIGLVIIVTAFVTWQRLVGTYRSDSAWGKAEQAYINVERFLENWDAPSAAVVMVNNPPGYYAMTGRQAIVIPDGDLQDSLHAGKGFKASYLILDENYPTGLGEYYHKPGNYPGLRYMDTIDQMQIYLIEK